MTESEMHDQIERERQYAEKEKQKAIVRTILTIVGFGGAFCMVGAVIDEDVFTQWVGLFGVGVMIVVLVTIYRKIVGE